MHRPIFKTAFIFLIISITLNSVSSAQLETSGWKKVVADFTAVAKSFGLEEANEPCIEYLRDDNTCMKQWKEGKLWRVVEENRIPILECNSVSMENIHHACQLKTWFVILIIILILIIVFSIIGCICCCICFVCECCRPQSKLSKSSG